MSVAGRYSPITYRPFCVLLSEVSSRLGVRLYLGVVLSRTERFFENSFEDARSGPRSRSNLPLTTPDGPFPALNVSGFLNWPSPLLVSTPTLPGGLMLETARSFLPSLLKSAAASVVGPSPPDGNSPPVLNFTLVRVDDYPERPAAVAVTEGDHALEAFHQPALRQHHLSGLAQAFVHELLGSL